MIHYRLIAAAICLAIVFAWRGAAVILRLAAGDSSGTAAGAEAAQGAATKKTPQSGDAHRAFGLEKRIPWTTSKFRGSPDPPPPYRAERIFPKLSFKNPTVLTSAPATDRMFVAEQAGKIFSIPSDPDVAAADLFLDTEVLARRLREEQKEDVVLEAVYGLTFHPRFAENRFCYVCYVVRYRDVQGGRQHPQGTRVSRFTVSRTDPPRCQPESEKLIISWLQGGHNGGCLKFGAEGYLYISSGDGGPAFPPDPLKAGQDVTRLLSNIMRIDVDREQPPLAYAVPADNPFVSLPEARGEVWAYGLRNPWKMSIDRKSGDLWVGDVGWELWEMVYRVKKADNFGWSIYEGPQPVHVERPRGPTPIVPPTVAIPHTEGASVTGGFVYRGKKFPELNGTYVFGDWESRRIWGVSADAEKVGPRREIMSPTVRVVDFAEDNDGELYLLDYDAGTIHAMVANETQPADHPFPRRLSQTGIFESVAEHRAAAGVLPFSINAQQWSDGALAERFLAVPGTGTIHLHAAPKTIGGSMFARTIEFPADTVLVKTLSLALDSANPSRRTRVETQVLHFDGRDWRGYAYEWNDDQTDAALVEGEGNTRTLTVADSSAPGGRRQKTWRYASRMECMRCHNSWSENALAFNIRQINRDHDFGGAIDNQIRAYRHVGLLEEARPDAAPGAAPSNPAAAKPPDELPRFADPFDSAADVNQRARTYLHVNCAHCHRDGGGGSAYLHLLHDLPLPATKALGARPSQGTFGIHDAKIIAPGDPFRSVLYFRMAKLGPGHMPYIGSSVVDERGLELIYDWIRQLPTRPDEQLLVGRLAALDEPAAAARDEVDGANLRRQVAKQLAQKNGREKPNSDDEREAQARAAQDVARRKQERAAERSTLIAELLADSNRAILLARALHLGRVPQATSEAIVDSAAGHSDAAVRDLFESFVPEERRVKRLGDAVKPEELLKLAGDLERGRQLFHKTAGVQCRNCHKIAQDGADLGPDLSQIGRKYDRAKMLESILDPSKNIEPQFVTWVVETTAGKVFTGLLVRKDGTEIVLKDAQNKPQRIPIADVEGTFQQQKSLMPELLLRELTAQQVADLLAYLASLK